MKPEEIDLDYLKAVKYIAKLYKHSDSPTEEEYIQRTGVEDFDPVIEDDIARLFKVILWATRPKKLLEIGTSIGFSTTTLARAAKNWGGTVVTLEIDEEVAKKAREIFVNEGVSQNIEIIVGDASETIKTLKEEYFDVVFQDSSKKLYPEMLNDCIRVLKSGGLYLVDDTLFPVLTKREEWSESESGIDEMNQRLAHLSLVSTILPIGEGCTVAVKK